MARNHRMTLLLLFVLSAVIFTTLWAAPGLAATKTFTIPNNTGQEANDLHLKFVTWSDGAGGTLGGPPTAITPNPASPFTTTTDPAPPYDNDITFAGGTVAAGGSVTVTIDTGNPGIGFDATWTSGGKPIVPVGTDPSGIPYKNGTAYSYYSPSKVKVSIRPHLTMTVPDVVDLGATFFGDAPATATFRISVRSNATWGMFVSGEDFMDAAGNTMPITQLRVRAVGDPAMVAVDHTEQLLISGSGPAPSLDLEYLLEPLELTPPGDYEAEVHWLAVTL